ncbi:hypothetical protein LIER_19742 [Lithospermum erythrorhizon]|uniref:Reverse transcriptase domain-containing protein n=1 Tax=Lithospermum erythrorhizon TaxID=34254 RepID=A0AAV3QL72_LITER
MKSLMDDLISLSQSAFLLGRNLGDSVLMLQELVHRYHKEDGVPKAAIKIDLEKAYDMVEWESLWVGMRWFPSTRGLRQGDPISSYLFIVVLEIFNGRMRKARKKSGFTFHPNCQQLGITHLSFAYDMIILVSADMTSFQVLKETLRVFGDLTSLKLNCDKSKIYFGSTPQELKKCVWEELRQREVKVPWTKWVCSRYEIARYGFVSWVLFHGKLSTKDRLLRWGMDVDPKCVFCSKMESQENLFFQCHFFARVWRLVLQKLGAYKVSLSCSQKREWCITTLRGRSFKKRLMQVAFMCAVYAIWQERNSRVFGDGQVSADIVYHTVVASVHGRASSWRHIKRSKENLRLYL